MIKNQQNKGWSLFLTILGIFIIIFDMIFIIPVQEVSGIIGLIVAVVFTEVNAYNSSHKSAIGAFRIELDITESQEKNIRNNEREH